MDLLQADSAAWGSTDLLAALPEGSLPQASDAAVKTAPPPADLPPMTAEALPPPPPSRPRPVRGGRVVVVGAGPAGLLAAAFLARAGAHVRVYERRPHPGPLPLPAGWQDDDDRAFAVAMNERGRAAIAAADLDVDALLSTPGAQLAAVRDQLLGTGDALPSSDHSGRSSGGLMTVRAERSRVIGSRQAFVRVLLSMVEQAAAGTTAAAAKDAASDAAGEAVAAGGGGGGPGGYGSIEFVWDASLESLDLTARTATFSLGGADGASGAQQDVQRYDLLVAADGFGSRCRRAAEAQAGGQLVVQVVPPNRQYKVCHRLAPQQGELGLWPDPAAAPGSSKAYGRLLMVSESAAATRAAGGGAPATLFFSQPTSDAVTAVLSMPHERWAAAGLADGTAGVEAYQALLAASFPTLPKEWAEAMAAQLAERPLHETGMQVHANQLHAPGLVLLGDAAHAVSPATSNGMNAALEDSAVLAQAVEAADGDLAAVPEQYTSARLEDAQALLWLDSALSGVAGRSGGEGPDPRATRAAVVARVALGALTRGLVRPHALIRLKDGGLPYAEARRAVERDAAVARVVTTGAGLSVVAGAAGALLAAGAARLRG